MKPLFDTLCIVGLGQMGGSLARAARDAGVARHVVGITHRAATAREAVRKRFVEEADTHFERLVREADVVVLATPVQTILTLIPALSPRLRPGALLTDLGSTKASVVRALDDAAERGGWITEGRRARRIRVCGSHPMCGNEVAGLAGADPKMFRGSTWVLTPGAGTDAVATRVLTSIVKRLGARPLRLEATQHDKIVAATSHVPFVWASALARAAAHDRNLSLMRRLVASGFRDTTRLASGDATLYRDILLTNTAPVRAQIRRVTSILAALDTALERGDGVRLEALFREAARARASLVGG
ncbi:MAG: prephenate dehydrogenase [Planctomycetes bacterium]|nr:prephenate dehydrogenase [Planctomycetota bacterium]